MDVILLIFTESGGFAGLKRGCSVAPAALPERPREELQGLLQHPLETPRLKQLLAVNKSVMGMAIAGTTSRQTIMNSVANG